MGWCICQMTHKAHVSIIRKQTVKGKANSETKEKNNRKQKMIKYKITSLNAIMQMIKEK